MHPPNAVELSRLRSRRKVLHCASAITMVGFAVMHFSWPELPLLIVLLLALAIAVALQPLRFRATRCPGCRANLFVPPGADAPDSEEEDGPLPDRCRTCGFVLLLQ
jgi:membrane protein YdbS with pleckstrin-like domain